MFIAWLQRLGLITLAFFVCSASAEIIQYPDTAFATRNTVTVTVVWLADYDEVGRVCHMLDRSRPEPESKTRILACYWPPTQTIYAVQPKNFNDEFNLMVLGHEFWHALGAEHP